MSDINNKLNKVVFKRKPGGSSNTTTYTNNSIEEKSTQIEWIQNS